jgi:hypothetical protein
VNIDWSAPFTIVSPTYGNFAINTPLGDGRIFRLNPKKCVGRRSIRATNDMVPQGDGEIFHPRFATGSEMQLTIQLWEGDKRCACDDVLVDMYDDLRGVLWSLLRPDNDGGRVVWTPSGKAARMIDAARLLSLSDPEEDAELGCTEITCVIDTPFPYAITEAENLVNFAASTTLPNAGNVEFYPVFKVYGPATSWAIENNDTGEIYLYDSSRPGASTIGSGDYAEIDMFRGGLIYLNGDEDNLKAGVDVEASDILTVAAGGSSYTVTATVDALLHDAYA